MRWIKPFIVTLFGLCGVAAVLINFRSFEVRRLAAQVEDLERERARLFEYVDRLSASRRVAQVDVAEQFTDQLGRPVSTLVWQEISQDGVLSEPLELEVVGRLVYFEAAVIKFAHRHVRDGDPEKGVSLALFRRIFGDAQTAASVPEFDRAARATPFQARITDAAQQRLWDLFWEMMADPALAERYGIRVAQCEAPAVVLKAGQIWEVTLDAAGGLNLRLIGERHRTRTAGEPVATTKLEWSPR